MADSASMFSALSGLQQNQVYMDVIGNNISNINTVGYKTASVRFEDLLYNTISGAQGPQNGLGGTNPVQIGQGVATAEVAHVDSQGSLQSTGRLTDFAILGNGFFVLNNGTGQAYTRDGSFTISPDGTLESGATGMKVMGYTGFNPDGSINQAVPASSVQLPFGQVNATATTTMAVAGNLSAAPTPLSTDPNAPPPTAPTLNTSITVYDSQGNSHALTLNFTRQGSAPGWSNNWNWAITDPNQSNAQVASGSLTFDNNGNPTGTTTATFQPNFGNNTNSPNITVDFSKIQQLSSPSQVNMTNQDGTPAGTISTFNVAPDGAVNAVFTNGVSKQIAVLQLAAFQNTSGLSNVGQNLYNATANSGSPLYGQPTQGTLGKVVTGSLESSNVDLAQQFTNMIMAERGFTANTRVITASDQMTQDAINIVR